MTSAGIDYNKVHRVESWTKERIKAELKKLKRKGISFRYNEFAKDYLMLLAAASFHFGSWRKAVSAVGIDYQGITKIY